MTGKRSKDNDGDPSVDSSPSDPVQNVTDQNDPDVDQTPAEPVENVDAVQGRRNPELPTENLTVPEANPQS